MQTKRVDYRIGMDPELLRLYRCCVWSSAYMGLDRLLWDRVLRDGIDATVERVRGECERRGLDWSWCMAMSLEDSLAETRGRRGGGSGLARRARERVEGSGNGEGFGYLGAGGFVDG